MSDNDCHHYIVEAGKEAAFDAWAESELAPDYSGEDFEYARCSHAPVCYTFTSPKVECS